MAAGGAAELVSVPAAAADFAYAAASSGGMRSSSWQRSASGVPNMAPYSTARAWLSSAAAPRCAPTSACHTQPQVQQICARLIASTRPQGFRVNCCACLSHGRWQMAQTHVALLLVEAGG